MGETLGCGCGNCCSCSWERRLHRRLWSSRVCGFQPGRPGEKSSGPLDVAAPIGEDVSIGQVSIELVAEELVTLRPLGVVPVFVGLRRLPPRRREAAAAMAAREGVTFIDMADPDRGRDKPSRFSTGGSSRIDLVRASDVNDVVREGVLSSFSSSDASSSLESESNRPG